MYSSCLFNPLTRTIQCRGISNNIQLLSKSRNYYDFLALTPRATQADIKDAYYKLSMQHHPDKNKSSGSSEKFKDINEAYEVLGNVRSRRLYDKGLFISRTNSYSETEYPVSKFYKSRDLRTRPPPPDGKTPIYDFDEWSKTHYGATFARDMANKKRRMRERVDDTDTVMQGQSDKFLIGLMIITGIWIYLSYERASFDEPTTVVILGGEVISTKKER